MAAAPLLDREFLEKLERLALRWQKSFPGLVGGHNTSRFPGAGQEFLDHRNFHHGDDLRAVNWRAYLRLEKLFLKMFQVEPRVPVRMLLDTSDSMTATAAANSIMRGGWRARCAMSGWCGWTASRLHPFSNQLGRRHLCTGGRHRFPGRCWMPWAPWRPAAPTDFLAVLREFIARYSQRGLVIVISDFLDDQGCERALQFLADFGHELMLLQIWSEEDRTPPWDGELELRDAETGAALKLHFDDAARRRYTACFRRILRGASRSWPCATAGATRASPRRSRWRAWSSASWCACGGSHDEAAVCIC